MIVNPMLRTRLRKLGATTMLGLVSLPCFAFQTDTCSGNQATNEQFQDQNLYVKQGQKFIVNIAINGLSASQ